MDFELQLNDLIWSFQVIQLISQGWLYFEPLNFVDWFTYTSAIMVTYDEGVQCQANYSGYQYCSVKRVSGFITVKVTLLLL
jgi:hypothetical protein